VTLTCSVLVIPELTLLLLLLLVIAPDYHLRYVENENIWKFNEPFVNINNNVAVLILVQNSSWKQARCESK